MANKNTDTVEVRATAKYVRVAPRKVRSVIALIRNKSVAQAAEILQFSTRAAADDVAASIPGLAGMEQMLRPMLPAALRAGKSMRPPERWKASLTIKSSTAAAKSHAWPGFTVAKFHSHGGRTTASGNSPTSETCERLSPG